MTNEHSAKLHGSPGHRRAKRRRSSNGYARRRQVFPFSRCVFAPELSTPKKPSQKASQKPPPSKRKKGGGAPIGTRSKGPHRKAMRRAPFLPSSHWRGPRPPRTSWSGRARLSAPHRGIPRFHRLGSGRASWNHRMQTGGPSPAPVQRAPRSPARAGRDDAQAARERSVSPRSREPPPLRLKEYPRERRPSRAGFCECNRYGDESQGRCRFIRDAS